ncbi:MAG: hypothetical protein QME06_08270 [Desulfobacterales bacterium]|nr:hypothetical protein [Desulfobacterales bacterium]
MDEPNLTFSNIFTVLNYLQDDGWKISRSGLYKHQAEGKIRPEPDGTYVLKNVIKYAKTWLKRRSTGKKLIENQESLQSTKLQKEIEKLDEEIKRNRHKREVEEGKYIPRDQFEMELASRVAVLDAGWAHLNQSKAADWIETVEGNPKKAGELIAALNQAKNGILNQYATTREFQVIIEEVVEEV